MLRKKSITRTPRKATSRNEEFSYNLGEFQPRSKREQLLIEHVLKHADEIRAARRHCDDRMIEISPYYSQKERRELAKQVAHVQSSEPEIDEQIKTLRTRLANLGDEPHNEAARFKLETEIYRLERILNDAEWPEIIDG